jgi:hypothetical protein
MNWIGEGRLPWGGRDVPKRLHCGKEFDENEAGSQNAARRRAAPPKPSAIFSPKEVAVSLSGLTVVI